ncbi:hypothetical protein [Burkholderia multivorans]|uniref:hypothetical protein n=1 Tax=Burkholderia multivorans TaxID=87883 RepID=UPI001C231F17|nr:hypothetical protein [Burkholderia multivorans]MBU9608715.1 hypothetical protein [Burkholderia multivorans]MBU9625720.1 hypothetical protein [Burkholderia multivorans]
MSNAAESVTSRGNGVVNSFAALEANYGSNEGGWCSLTLCSLGFAVCELHNALILKELLRAGKTPKAGVARSIPAGRAKLPVQAFLSVAFRFVVVSIALTYIAGFSAVMREGTSALGRLAVA